MANDINEDIEQMRKNVAERFPMFEKYVDAQNELIRLGSCLLTGGTWGEDLKQFYRLIAHVESLWDASVALFKSGCYPQCVYLAIACIEEIGKVGTTRFQLVLRKLGRDRSQNVDAGASASRRDNPFYSHREKHLLAAGAGAIINSRLERLITTNRLIGFLDSIADGSLEKKRQSALYADTCSSGPCIPCELIDQADALFYVIVAGELLAEVLGFDPKDWERLLRKVQEFEKNQGAPYE